MPTTTVAVATDSNKDRIITYLSSDFFRHPPRGKKINLKPMKEAVNLFPEIKDQINWPTSKNWKGCMSDKCREGFSDKVRQLILNFIGGLVLQKIIDHGINPIGQKIDLSVPDTVLHKSRPGVTREIVGFYSESGTISYIDDGQSIRTGVAAIILAVIWEQDHINLS